MLLGIRSPGASALVTEDLQHDIRETRLSSVPLGVATVPGTRCDASVSHNSFLRNIENGGECSNLIDTDSRV